MFKVGTKVKFKTVDEIDVCKLTQVSYRREYGDNVFTVIESNEETTRLESDTLMMYDCVVYNFRLKPVVTWTVGYANNN